MEKAMVKINSVNVGKDDDGLNEQQKTWWKEISALSVDIFGLSDKIVGDFAKPLNLDKDALYLMVSAPAAVPAIEIAIEKLFELERTHRIQISKYHFSMEGKYLVIKPNEGDIVKGAGGKPIFVSAWK